MVKISINYAKNRGGLYMKAKTKTLTPRIRGTIGLARWIKEGNL